MYKTIDFGQNLYKAITDKGMTQVEFAKKTGLTEVTISRYINGSRTPDIKTTCRLCKVLGISVSKLLNYYNKCESDIDLDEDPTLEEFIKGNNFGDYSFVELSFRNPIQGFDSIITRINSIPQHLLDKKIGVVGKCPFHHIEDPYGTLHDKSFIIDIYVKN